MSKPVQLYPKQQDSYDADDILSVFYNALVSKDSKALKQIHIPRSEVFYVRAHLQEVFPDRDLPLDYVERIMYLEGMLSRKDVLDPDRPRLGIG